MHIEMRTLSWPGGTAAGVAVRLPRTTLLCLSTPHGYLMCGALDVPVLDALHPERNILAARAVGVSTLEELLQAPVHDCTEAAARLGIAPGMPGSAALSLMGDDKAAAHE